MKVTLTKEEAQFLLSVLDQIQVSGLERKTMVVSIMAKIAKEIENDKEPHLPTS